MSDTKEKWIQAGYELFALEGPHALKVEVLARTVAKNKSSFYHYFAELAIFQEQLLQHHIERSKVIAELERQCKSLVPELLELIVELKIDLLFNRQLRIHRSNPAFCACQEQSGKIVAGAISGIWATGIDLPENEPLADLVLQLSIENFYLQITPETLNYDWLVGYIGQLRELVKGFKNNHWKEQMAMRQELK